MEVNRLEELKRNAKLPERRISSSNEVKIEMGGLKGGSNKDMADHMSGYKAIKEGLGVIRRNVNLIEKLKDEEAENVEEKHRKEIMAKLDRIMAETTQAGKQIKGDLEMIKKDNDEYKKDHKNSATTQMRINLYQTHLRRFHQTMNSYNQASHNFKKALKDRTRRQLAIVDKNLSPQEIEKIVDSGSAQEVITQALISEELDDVVAEIEERHQGIVKLEQQVLEVYELFHDLATLVELQQESLDVIENRVNMAKDYAEKAQQELGEAEEYQLKARKRACYIMMIVIIILVVVLGPILGTQL